MQVRIAPVDIERDGDLCAKFRRDAFVCSFGNAEEFDHAGGAAAYLGWLRARAAEFPEGIAHVWAEDEIVGQLEFRINRDRRDAYVHLFYLIPRARGGDVGGSLHRYMVDVLRRTGISIAKLAVHYYRKHGWIDRGAAPDRADLHVMELRLDGGAA